MFLSVLHLVEFYHDLHSFLLDAFACRNGEFFALLPRLASIRITVLAFRRAVARVHVALYILVVCLDKLDDLVLNRPLEKIQLSDGGFHRLCFVIGDLDALPPTKRVKTFLAVSLQLEFVVIVYLETTGFAITVREFIYSEILLRVVRHEPVHNAEGDLGFAVDDGDRLCEIIAILIKGL